MFCLGLTVKLLYDSGMRILLPAFLVLALVGCTTETKPGTATAVPSDKIFQPALLTPSGARNVPLTVTRDTGIIGMGSSVVLLVDGKEVAKLGAGQVVTIYVTPGQVVLELRHGFYRRQYPETIAPRTPKRYRLEIMDMAGPFLWPSPYQS